MLKRIDRQYSFPNNDGTIFSTFFLLLQKRNFFLYSFVGHVAEWCTGQPTDRAGSSSQKSHLREKPLQLVEMYGSNFKVLRYLNSNLFNDKVRTFKPEV